MDINIAITGGAGSIAYQLTFLLLNKLSDKTIHLRLLDLESQMHKLTALKMEIEDCAFKNLASLVITSDIAEAFTDAQLIIMLGSYPRLLGMERKDLLIKNGIIFREQGRYIDEYAADDVQVIVVGNPCNTNAMIASSVCRRIPFHAFTALSLLDQNRAAQSLANYLDKPLSSFKDLAVWGNHSSTVVPDIWNSKINGQKVQIDQNWVYNIWIPFVRQRGADIIAKKGSSSSASAAHAILEHIENILAEETDIFSICVKSHGEYGSTPGTWVSMPHKKHLGKLILINKIEHDDRMLSLIEESFTELAEERQRCLEIGIAC